MAGSQKKVISHYKASFTVLQEVAEIYNWLDKQLYNNRESAGRCNACGKCCDFDAFDHRLFVTVPELMYLTANLEVDSLKSMPRDRCPYNIDGKCTVYEHRFAGCRIFCCTGDTDFQSSLSEAALEKLRAICIKFDIPYRYTDLSCALNNPGGD